MTAIYSLESAIRARPHQATEGGRYLDREERLEGLLRRRLTNKFMGILSRNSTFDGKPQPQS